MIEIANLTKSYGGLNVYRNFCVSFNDGEITCLLGASGCGKTTLLNIIAGLTGYEGSVPPLDCSYIFQNPTLVPNLTVRGNLSLVCKDEKKVLEMIEKIRLTGREKSYPVNLSGGEAQRVAIARAFLKESDILLMDEPFSSLDLKLKYRMLDLFFEIWKEDKRTVLMVTHDIDEALIAAHRIIVLEGGKIKADFRPGTNVPREPGGCVSEREKLVQLLMN